MDYYLWFHFLKDVADGGWGGYVGIVVGGALEAVLGCSEVEDGDLCGGGFEELGDDVVA